MGVAASDQAFRLTTLQSRSSCRYYDRSVAALTTGTPLPAASDNRALGTTVDRVLRSLGVGQPVSLDSHCIEEYGFDDGDDRLLVDGARRTGRGNAVTHRILEGSLCLDPHVTAESQVRRNWPFVTPDTAQHGLQIVAAPPVGLEVEIDDDSATGQSPPEVD